MNLLSNVFTDDSFSINSDAQSRIHEFKNIINQNSKSILLNFPSVSFDKPALGCYEANAQFYSIFTPDFDANIQKKHEIPVSESPVDILAETSKRTESQPSVNPLDRQPLLKRLLFTYLESGIVGICEDLGNLAAAKKYPIPEGALKASELVAKFIDAIYAPISPLIMSNEINYDFDSIKGRKWKSSLIRAFQWHPFYNKFAIAFKNDTVKVYSKNQSQVILKHQKQKNITCIAWKPFHSSIIAIGCADSIIIWDIDALPVSIKPASSCSFELSKRYHNDILDLQWYPKSDFLLSVASKDNQIMIWDITLKECLPIKRVGTTGFNLARFSPNGSQLFTSDLSATFRVWNPINYTSEKWTNLVSRCNASSWSPDGTVLLFSCDNCSLLYSLKFLSNNKQELQVVCDLSSVLLINDSETENNVNLSKIQHYSVGGTINDLCWDPSGHRLAVTFKTADNNESNINVVAVFITKFQPQFQVLPCGLINDPDNSWPVSLGFKPNFNDGALMTICWSNARVQQVPFYFTKIFDDNKKNIPFRY